MTCTACGALNRVPRDRLEQGRTPRCGRCKAPLPASGAPVTVTDATFPAEVERSPLPMVLDLWAPWCGPCRIIAPIVDDLAVEMAGRVRFGKLNIDENPGTATRFNVRSIPTLLVLRDGDVVARQTGALPLDRLRTWITSTLAA